jgi:transcriptional regulator with XRE-family HTH domain
MTWQWSGRRLRAIREDAGLSITALAAKIDRSYFAVYGIETGRGYPSCDVMLACANALRCNPGDFFERVPDALAA